MPETDDTSVRVAVRVRPQNAKERIDMSQICTTVDDSANQILLGKDKPFTYDYVFDIPCKQEAIFCALAKPLIDGCLEGYNATLFAYGQTGSGKTYTMGTAFDLNMKNSEVGIIPRAVQYMFQSMEKRRKEAIANNEPPPEFKVVSQFLELYNEELNDLLDGLNDNRSCKNPIKIHEDAQGSIYITGVSTRVVTSLDDTMKCLKDGALCRSTASTKMNAQSSRSHAIFTLHIKQQRLVKDEELLDDDKEIDSSEKLIPEFETLSAKFHFVDLAGSERLKRTGATGDRAKEGISINFGLLALGNVISALGDKNKRGCHVPYRDSKLTRLLQDSLGGNSRTIMIACVSPSDCDFVETMSALKYANRARNIKNKISINQDKTSKQLAALRIQISSLQDELIEFKQGKRVANAEGSEGYADMFTENTFLQGENNKLLSRIKALQMTVDSLKAHNAKLLVDSEMYNWSKNRPEGGSGSEEVDDVMRIVDKYAREAEDLRAKLAEAESLAHVLQRRNSQCNQHLHSTNSHHSGSSPSRVAMSLASDFPEDALDLPPLLLSPILGGGSGRKLLSSSGGGSRRRGMRSRRKRAISAVDKENRLEEEGKGGEDAMEVEAGGFQGNGDLIGIEGDLEDAESDEDEEDDEEGDDDVMETDESDTSDDAADEVDSDALHETLLNVSTEIDVKKRLIEAIQTKQKQLQQVKDHYERQLVNLQVRIKATETERDTVLANLGLVEHSSEEKIRQVRGEYEKKLTGLQDQLRNLTTTRREYASTLREQERKENKLRQLHSELEDLKRLKVQMSKKIREEAKRTREVESTHNREVAQLRKEKRVADNQIRNLELEKKQRELILRRKQEEVEALRKRNIRSTAITSRSVSQTGSLSSRPGSAFSQSNGVPPSGPLRLQTSSNTVGGGRRNGVGGTYTNRRKSTMARLAKAKWDALERSLAHTVSRQIKIGHFERDMNNYVNEREKLGKKLDTLSVKHTREVDESKDVSDTDYELKNTRSQIESLQENIHECQMNIIELEEAKAEPPSSLLHRCSLEESRYLLQNLYEVALGKGILAHQKELEERDLRAQLEAKSQERDQAMEMLHVALHNVTSFDWESIRAGNSDLDNLDDESSSDTAGQDQNTAVTRPTSLMITEDFSLDAKKRLRSGMRRISCSTRRKTATPEELLGVGGGSTSNSMPAPPSTSMLTPLEPLRESAWELPDRMTMSLDDTQLMPPPRLLGFPRTKLATDQAGPDDQSTSSAAPTTPVITRLLTPLSVTTGVPTGPSQASGDVGGGPPLSAGASPNAKRKHFSWKHPGGSMTTSLIVNKPSGPHGRPLSRVSTLSFRESATVELTPPTSPNSLRRSNSVREGNVFNRLTINSNRGSPNPTKGMIYPFNKQSLKTNLRTPLECTHIAEGHTKAVLDVDVSDVYMVTGSKDRTGKLWDLTTMTELATLSDHPNNVTKVRYSEASHLIFTVCAYFIKLWDSRDTTKSSGLSQEEPLESTQSIRQNICPAGQTNIMDLVVSKTGEVMFLATANSVKLWDLRRFCAVGKLHGNHQAPVMVLAMDEGKADNAGNVTVVTGSKDHYIKAFSVPPAACGLLTPTADLQPPHYDGIEALALRDNVLFSGSRDASIKKWDVRTATQESSMMGAHRDWIQGLCLTEDGLNLLSGCRAGLLKLWNVEDCSYLGEVQAHNAAINAVKTNGDRVFTVSNDNTVRFWKVSEEKELMV